MKMRTDRRGMTLVELLIVAVLGAFILGAIFQVLITNQRTFAVQNAQIQGQQTLRAGADVLFGELREISPEDGDIVSMADQGIHIRAARSVGVICRILGMPNPPPNNPAVQVKKLGRFLRGDSARVFYENDPNIRGDDVWRTAVVDIVDTTGTLNCPDGETGQEVQLDRVRFDSPPDSFLTGALVRNFVHYRYRLGDYNGRSYLLRIDENGATPLVGPLDPDDGVTFTYLDDEGNVTTNRTDVRQIQVKLLTTSDVRESDGDMYADSLVTRIHTRNSTN